MPTFTPPTRCLEPKPCSQSIRFGGRYISMSKLELATDVQKNYISRILSGKRRASVDVLLKLCGALGMNLESFRAAVAERKEAIRQKKLSETDEIFEN